MSLYSAAIIGLGNIGLGYDYDDQDGSMILTHAAAFSRHQGFNLIGAVDADPEKCQLFTAKYGLPAWGGIDELYRHANPEIVAIAVPTAWHMEVFTQVIEHTPLAIMCEKPLAGRVEDAERMVALAQRHDCTLLVNYIRRFEPGVLALKALVEQHITGDIYKGTVWYTKGLLNNGSHFVDLLSFLLGAVSGFRVVHRNDGRHWSDDPEPDVAIRFGDADVVFLAGRHDCFSMADIELVGTAGIIRYADGGRRIEYQKVVPDEVYGGYATLDKEAVSIPTDLYQYQLHVLDALYRFLTEGIALVSDGQSALVTQVTIDAICNQL
jgi:predicted dehydrogenase